MNKNSNSTPADTKKLRSLSTVWYIPILAIFIGLWMIYFNLSNQGTLVTIYFKAGDDIEAGKTKIKIKNVEIGIVKNLQLNDNLEGVAVTAQIKRNYRHLLKQDSQFWVVRPRIGKGGISGLGTLLSGAYIEFTPGLSGIEIYEYTGLENKPITPVGTPGLHVTLNSGNYQSLQVGDQILFHGIITGRIEHVYFNAEERMVYYDAFIESPYDKLITTNTKFWEINGFEVDLSANGLRVQTGTLETMISGGIAFDVPKNLPRGDVITERSYYFIHPNKNAIYDSYFKYELHYILLFKDSIRGLKPGAPVEYRGIKIGTVSRTDINYPEITDLLDQNTQIPVMITIEPARMGFKDDKKNLPIVNKKILKLVKNGLHGGLANSNLITGSKYIELRYEHVAINSVKSFDNLLVIPTYENDINKTISKFSKVIDKLNSAPLKPVMNSADKTLQQLTLTLKELQLTSTELRILVNQTTDKNFVGSILNTLDNTDNLINSFTEGSLTHKELQNNLTIIKDTIGKLQPFLNQLNEKPDSLIFGKTTDKDKEPKGIKK